MEKKNGLGFLTVLALIFITLKLCNVIDWSWWWVLAPLYGGLSLILSAFIVLFSGGAIIIIIKETVKSIFKLSKQIFWF